MDTVTDPVCGKHLEPAEVVATANHAGVTYSFCSEECRDRFVEGPEDYLRQPAETTCPNCGGAITQDDVECPHCGISLVSG